MLPNKAKQTLAANLRLLSGGTDTQAFRERIAKKTGGEVSARTIGTMMSSTTGNPTLANIEAVATALSMTVAELLTENLGRNKQEIVPPGAASPAGWGPSPAAKPAMAAHHPVGSALAHSAIGSHPNQAPSALVAAAMRLDVAPHVTQSTRDSLVALLNALASPR
ncbi:hypothetical protein [Thauera aromatica]|uniref:hypothetical protein n=1 Tax=Thauera aromatica TaxID=59405 RepID=UPI001FFD673B|nr:hypothetical protein [Thauera aromatica]MCK2095204.1 hypothetical protein [Thauera aromatica]